MPLRTMEMTRQARKGVGSEPALYHERAAEGIIVVDATLQPIALDDGAESILREMKRSRAAEGAAFELPVELQEILREGRLQESALAERLTVVNGQFTCRIFLMQPHTDGHGRSPLIAVHLKKEVSIPDVVRHAAAEYRLTQREQEAVVGICMGLTSRELADRMSISPNTVNAFLRTIMLKMGVTTRAGVVGKLLEENGSQPEAVNAD